MSTVYYSCENVNEQHSFETITLLWKGVEYDNISRCKVCGAIYNFGFDVTKVSKKKLLGIDLETYKMKEPTRCSQQALFAKQYGKVCIITKEQQAMWDKMLDVIRADIAEERKHTHAYPIWRVTYNG